MKLNKTQTQRLAGELAVADTHVTLLTESDIRKMDYQETQLLARTMAVDGLQEAGLRVEPKFIDAFTDAFISQAQKVWAGKVKLADNERLAFKRACDGMTAEEAMADIKKIVEDFHLRGTLRMNGFDDGHYGSLEVQRGDDVDATLYVKMNRDYNGLDNPDDISQRAGEYEVEVEISWAGTSRNTRVAMLSSKLYAELAEMGWRSRHAWRASRSCGPAESTQPRNGEPRVAFTGSPVTRGLGGKPEAPTTGS